jgi:hypothetical protein
VSPEDTDPEEAFLTRLYSTGGKGGGCLQRAAKLNKYKLIHVFVMFLFSFAAVPESPLEETGSSRILFIILCSTDVT